MEEEFSRRILKRACFSEIVKVIVFEEIAACVTREGLRRAMNDSRITPM